ncbi:AMP-binding protein [Specibacter cremeus]|uniref:AMP-binding protein n=1 Tax=Specibacter cremeus TaxID=1629051 RepID=UPI000F7AB68E|nr:AMP-binding protein [Specibacter cremeus]
MYALTMCHLLWRMRNVHPDSGVVAAGPDAAHTSRCTYGELTERIEALAVGLREDLGLRPGGTATVLGWNDQPHLELMFAVPLIGARVNSLNLRVGAATLAGLGASPIPDIVVVGSGVLEHPAVGADVAGFVAGLRDQGVPVIGAGDAAPDGAWSYESLVRRHLGRRLPDEPGDENATAFIFHTSGTTGSPKSYEVTHRAALLHSLSQATVDASGIRRSDRVLPLAPFFHVNGWGLPLTCALTGASLVLAGADLGPARVAALMDEERVTVAAAVPTVWHDVCAAVDAGTAPRPRALREVLTGGSPVSESLCRSIRTVLGAGVATAWGMTETMACSAYERELPHRRAGRPIPLIELAIDDGAAQDEAADPGTAPPGRLLVRGPFVVGAPGESWCATGDIATLDPGGNLTLRDREKDLIKSGGEWIVSAELEQHLCRHPAVASAVVVPVPHPRWGERPVAYIVPADAVVPGEAELSDYLARTFPCWWVPDRIVVVERLPTTAVGKIDKKALRKIANPEKEPV